MLTVGTIVFSGQAMAGNVASTSITCNPSCSGNAGNVGVDAQIKQNTGGNILDVTLRAGNTDGPRDLSTAGTGATTSTEYEVEVTLNDYDPTVASGAGNFQSTWTETHGGGQTTIAANIRPLNVQWDDDAGNTAINDPGDSHWDAGNKQADSEFTMVDFSMFNNAPGNAEGSYLNTNSQSRATVNVDTTNNEFKVSAAGPHFNTAGNLNSGFFKAYLSGSMATKVFGASNTNQYYTSFGSQSSNSPSVNSMAGNTVELTWDGFHYSAGNAAAGADTTDPVASTQSDTTVTKGTSVSFDGTGSTDENGISSYEWDWTNDATYEGSGSTASHTYSSTGTYTATLRVTDGNGNTDTDTRTVTVNSGSTGSANIEITATRLNATDLTVGDASMTSVDLENTGDKSGDRTLRYKINDDLQADEYVNLDTGEKTTVRFNSTFDNTGEYDITVGIDTSVGTVTVSEAVQTTLTAVAQENTTAEAGSTVQFDGSQSTASGNITSYEWDWTSDGTYDGSGSTATHTYTSSGTYTVTLRVTDDSGTTDTATRTVTVTTADKATDTSTAAATEISTATSTTSAISPPQTTGSEPTTVTATDTATTSTATTEEPTAGSGPLSPGLAVLAVIIVAVVRRRQ
jgi:PKD repeat protein